MTALDQLNAYLQRLELRMRLLAASRGAAIIACSAVLLTAVLAWLCNRFAFAAEVVLPVRILLYLAVTAVIVFGLVMPLLRLNRRWIARRAEQQMAGFEQRLLTITERSDPANPFTELLAEDALEIAQKHDASELAPSTTLWGLVGSAAVALGILVWLIFAAPGYWGYGASLLWAGTPRSNGPLYDIVVHPGNRTVRRKSDQMVTADLVGFSADKVTLYARYKNGVQWEQASMQPQREGNGYEFLFAGLSDPVDYYISTGRMKSKTYKIDVKDMASVKRLRVTVHYPAYLDLKDQVTDPGGDVRALQGSRAEISVLTDRPLDHGVLMMEDGRKLKLDHSNGNWLTAQLDVTKDGSYHVAALDDGDAIRLSDDYFIEARKDSAPNVKIVNPTHDPHVSPIEELPVSVQSSDDFGLKNVELHYSVNGGPEKTITLSKSKGEKQAESKTTLSFEDFKMVPGDLVSFYATTSDAKSTSRTDLLFAQAEPFDLRFQQSQQSGGGGGGMGNDNNDISQRQKEIIAATWNELKNGASEKSAAAEEAKFLSEVEGKLGAQAKTLADRMRSRELSGSNAEFDEFSKQMDRASAEMGTAVGQLKGGAWHDSLPPEQRALQALTRAESLFKDIQIAYGRMNGSSMGGGAGSAGRDLERMFDLELDPEKNQYETGESASSQSQQQKNLQDALERLKELARRQQDLAQQRQPQQSSQDRWEQEMLRREAEQLQRQMEQLSQNQRQGQNGQQSSSQNGSQGSSSSSSRSRNSSQGAQSAQSAGSASGSSGTQAGSQQLQTATNALQRAQEEMRSAVSQHDSSAQQRAAADLQAAAQQLREMQRQQAGNSISDLAAQAQDMLQHQKDFSNRLRQAASAQNSEGNASDNASERRYGYGGGRWNRDPYDPTRRSLPGGSNRQIDRLADEKQQMSQQLEQLQRQVQRQAQNLAGGQPQVSSKLRDAVSGIQQQDLASHMKKNADWIRQGYAAETWVNEQGATMALDQFNRQMQEAQQLAQNAGPGKGGAQPGDDTQRALQQVEDLRRQLSQQAAQRGSQGGQANQTGQPGSQSGQPSNDAARNGGAMPGGNPAIAEAMQNMASLRQQLGPRSGRAYYDSEYAYRFLQDLQGADPSELAARLNREVLPTLQRLEVDLKRQGKMPPDAGRVAAPEPTPANYADSVAEYFKKLSQ
jgi:hypothetical protein